MTSDILTYLGREIRFISDNDGTELPLNIFGSSVLLVTGDEFEDELMKEIVLAKIDALRPLSIMAAGNAKEKIFSYIFDMINGNKSYVSIVRMADGNTIDEYISEFLWSAWPSEEDFDSWEDYFILSLNNDMDQIRSAICKFKD